MPYYDTFMNVNKHPAQRWRNQLQDTVDKVFENASTWWDDVWEEREFGSDALETITTNEEKRKERFIVISIAFMLLVCFSIPDAYNYFTLKSNLTIDA